jgi:hypothetical protein
MSSITSYIILPCCSATFSLNGWNNLGGTRTSVVIHFVVLKDFLTNIAHLFEGFLHVDENFERKLYNIF